MSYDDDIEETYRRWDEEREDERARRWRDAKEIEYYQSRYGCQPVGVPRVHDSKGRELAYVNNPRSGWGWYPKF